MSYLSDLDTYYVNSISALHSIDYLISSEPSVLQAQLEEAIASKTGTHKDFIALIDAIKQPTDIYKNLTSTVEEKTTSSSDNELELDLLKEDLMCIVCKGMDVGAKNRLLECSDCHSLFHQECHQPIVTPEEADNTWVCQTCKEQKIVKSSPSYSKSSHSVTKESSKSSYRPSSSTHHSYKSSYSSKSSSSSHKSSDKVHSSSKSSGSNGSSRSSSTVTSNIISADKRIQNMKKKAAKLK